MVMRFFLHSRKKLGAAPGKRLCKDAKTALKEAAARRSVGAPAAMAPDAPEMGKPEPTRFGDWEFGGRCSDF